MSARARKANLVFWLTQLKKGRTISLGEEKSNLLRAIETGLSDPSTFSLTADLLIRLQPLVMRSESINIWITYYQVAARKGGQLSASVHGNLRNQLGALNWQLGRNASALIQFRKGQELSRAHNLIQDEAMALVGVSLVKWTAHDYRNAFLEARRAVRRFRSKLSGQVVLSRLIAVKGITAYAVGEFRIAETCFREALKMPGWQDLQSQIQFKINLALVESNERELYSAEKRLKKLSKKLEKQPGGSQFLGKIELLRAVVSQRKGDTEVALGILERAAEADLLSVSGAEQAWAESAMGRLLLKRGNPSQGKLWLKSASLLWEKLSDPWMVLDTLKIFDGTL